MKSINSAGIFGWLSHKLPTVLQKHHTANESALWNKQCASQHDDCAHLLLIFFFCAFSKSKHLFSSFSTNWPSVFIASISTRGHVLWWHSAACVSVCFLKGTPEPVYWLQMLLLCIFHRAHNSLATESRSLPCSPQCHQSQREKQNFLSRYFVPVPPLFRCTW